MDPTLIGAIITALATIIASLGAALISLRSTSSRDREQLVTIVQATALIGKRALAAKEVEERTFLEENLESISEVSPSVERHLKRAEIIVHPGEANLNFVVQKDNPRPAFNVLTKLSNTGQQLGIIDGLETILTGPGSASFRFAWNLFYEYQRSGLLHTLSSYIHPVAVPPGSSLLLGIQFIGPDLGIDNLYSWSTGRYQCEMIGWMNRRPDGHATNLSSTFFIDISAREIARLKEWTSWNDNEWAQFPHPDHPDPDKAAGLPIKIIPS